MQRYAAIFLGLVAFCAGGTPAEAAPPRQLLPERMHLRSGAVREWSEFPEQAAGDHLEHRFTAAPNDEEMVLLVRQHDVKQSWRVLLNGQPLGDLVQDERDQRTPFRIAAKGLLEGENVLRIERRASKADLSDDVHLGPVWLVPQSNTQWLSESQVEIEVVDEQGTPIPCCLTITDLEGTLHPVGAASNEQLAVRTGVVYTASGQARFGLPTGRYTITAGRGFEYSLATKSLVVEEKQSIARRMTLRREAPLDGYVACDTHIHTLTHSGHGDATIDERMITIVGEGIELPIATDHNVNIDFEPHARRLDVRQHFTPVVGNEVTTKVGHFNVFPLEAGARPPDASLTDWKLIFEEIFSTSGARVAILNHARDLHSQTRPFGPALFNPVVAEQLEGWPLRFNAMEVVNSGATQTEPLRLLHDWMGLLNRGYTVTPVGSSDSHDVSRSVVGQGRTYIRCDDSDPGKIDVTAAIDSFLAGRVLVSYGLVAELQVDGKFASGDFATDLESELEAKITVRGPHWTTASKVQLYANGQLLGEKALPTEPKGDLPTGVKWEGVWRLKRPTHDVHLVAIATGPGIAGPYWPTAKPYQPTSPDWQAQVIGASGAVWLDGDGDGVKSCARDYAKRRWQESDKDVARLIDSLGHDDAAIAAHAAHLYHTSGGDLSADGLQQALKAAAPAVRDGFRAYATAWRECELARQK